MIKRHHITKTKIVKGKGRIFHGGDHRRAALLRELRRRAQLENLNAGEDLPPLEDFTDEEIAAAAAEAAAALPDPSPPTVGRGTQFSRPRRIVPVAEEATPIAAEAMPELEERELTERAAHFLRGAQARYNAAASAYNDEANPQTEAELFNARARLAVGQQVFGYAPEEQVMVDAAFTVAGPGARGGPTARRRRRRERSTTQSAVPLAESRLGRGAQISQIERYSENAPVDFEEEQPIIPPPPPPPAVPELEALQAVVDREAEELASAERNPLNSENLLDEYRLGLFFAQLDLYNAQAAAGIPPHLRISLEQAAESVLNRYVVEGRGRIFHGGANEGEDLMDFPGVASAPIRDERDAHMTGAETRRILLEEELRVAEEARQVGQRLEQLLLNRPRSRAERQEAERRAREAAQRPPTTAERRAAAIRALATSPYARDQRPPVRVQSPTRRPPFRI